MSDVTTLAGQQHELIKRFSLITDRLTSHLTGGFTTELHEVIAARLKSGEKVFGTKMFTMPATELRFEAIEELADAFLWYFAFLWVDEHGPLERGIQVGDKVKVKRNGPSHLVGESGTVVVLSEGTKFDYLVEMESIQPEAFFYKSELELVTNA